MARARWVLLTAATAASCAFPGADIVPFLGTGGGAGGTIAGNGGQGGHAVGGGGSSGGGHHSGGGNVAGADDPGSDGGEAGQSMNSAGNGGDDTTSGGGGASGSTANGGGGAFGGGGTATGGGGTGGAGTSGGGHGGAGSANGGGGTGGGAGAPPVTPYCNDKTPVTLPLTLTTSFVPSFYYGDAVNEAQQKPNGTGPCAAGARIAGAVGLCSGYRFTPNPAGTAMAGVSWSTMFDANYTHPPVCLPITDMAVTFAAKGSIGGEVVRFGVADAQAKAYTLTSVWAEYSFSLVGVKYNSDEIGLQYGFRWEIYPPATQIDFYVDDLRIVAK